MHMLVQLLSSIHIPLNGVLTVLHSAACAGATSRSNQHNHTLAKYVKYIKKCHYIEKEKRGESRGHDEQSEDGEGREEFALGTNGI